MCSHSILVRGADGAAAKISQAMGKGGGRRRSTVGIVRIDGSPVAYAAFVVSEIRSLLTWRVFASLNCKYKPPTAPLDLL